VARLNYERAATILVEAAYFGDKQAADRYGVSVRTVERYRARMDEDDELSAFVAIKKQKFEDEWADELPGAIRASIRFLGRAAQEASAKDPQAIHSVAGSLKILADVALTKQVLDARLTGRGEPETEENRQVVADS
jgi:hypothetical protein